MVVVKVVVVGHLPRDPQRGNINMKTTETQHPFRVVNSARNFKPSSCRRETTVNDRRAVRASVWPPLLLCKELPLWAREVEKVRNYPVPKGESGRLPFVRLYNTIRQLVSRIITSRFAESRDHNKILPSCRAAERERTPRTMLIARDTGD